MFAKFGSNVLKGSKLVQKIITNPIGFQATKVLVFSDHRYHQPLALLRDNKETCLTDVKVFYPKNTLVGIDIYYEPTSTIGLLDDDLAPRTIESYALYNDKVDQLPDFEEE